MNRIEQYFKDKKCLIIAEIAQAHDGSLGTAHAYIDAAAKAGADSIKFQTHIAEAESTLADQWRVKFSYQDDTRFDYWKRMEFTADQWAGLKKHADEKGLIFLSSPFSIEAVEMLENIGMEAWKIASGEISNTPMLNRIIETGKPIIISSGMSDIEELDKLVAKIKAKNIPLGILQCTTAYPTPPEKVGLNVMQEFKKRYDCPTGLSDHSGTIFAGLAGSALGMDILELHITFSRQMFGPDVVASITTEELKWLVDGIRFIEKMNANPVAKDEAANDTKPMRKLFTKSIVAKTGLEAGTVINESHLAYKKPGTGIPAEKFLEIIGKQLKHTVKYNHFFTEEDFI